MNGTICTVSTIDRKVLIRPSTSPLSVSFRSNPKSHLYARLKQWLLFLLLRCRPHAYLGLCNFRARASGF